MTKSKTALALVVASLATLLIGAGTANACHRDGCVSHPRLYAKRVYPGNLNYYRNYRNACGYGDCPCFRRFALATGSRVWWDRYDACTG